MQVRTRGTIKFGACEVDLSAREFRKNGRKIRLQDQAFEILVLLLRDPGTLVTREEMRQLLWPRETFVDFEHGLNRVISKLREALGDSVINPKYIETVARHGYRIIAPTEVIEPAGQKPVVPKVRLAVMPFIDLSADPTQEFFSDGMTEEMIAQLGRLHPERLGVIARTSAMQYKGSNKGVEQIGRELRVDYILEGSVRRVAERVRITAQLIAVADETHLWAESYDCDLKDVLAIQLDVATRVRRSLAATLLPAEPVKDTRVPSVDSAAYDAYLRGRYFWSKRHEGGLRKAIECFERAIQQDSGFALAYSGLADACALLSWYGELPPRQARLAAEFAAAKAVQINQELGEAHASLGLIRFWYDWDWPRAQTEFQRALELSPNYAIAHQWFASYLVAMGRFDEASEQLKRALELDPLSLIIVQSMGDPLYYARRYDDAVTQYRRAIELNSEFAPAHFCLGRAYAQKGMYQEAIAEFQKANAISGRMEAAPAMAHALARLGARSEAMRILDQLISEGKKRYVAPLPIALIHLGLGQEREAIEWMERAFEERSCWLVFSKVDPILDPIRKSPNFQSLLTKLGLEEPHSAIA